MFRRLRNRPPRLLPFREVSRSYFRDYEGGRARIQDVLKEGMEVIVQVEKDERCNKGGADHFHQPGLPLFFIDAEQPARRRRIPPYRRRRAVKS